MSKNKSLDKLTEESEKMGLYEGDTLARARLRARRKIQNPIKNKKNPHFKNDYADLEQVIASVMDACLSEGIEITQSVEQREGQYFLITELMLASTGEARSWAFPIFMARSDIQGMASGVSYSRRYALNCIFCLAQEDDDGQKASQTPPTRSMASQEALNRDLLGYKADIAKALLAMKVDDELATSFLFWLQDIASEHGEGIWKQVSASPDLIQRQYQSWLKKRDEKSQQA